ncbi:MAG: pyruvate dehydrogenase (acetyl-transferring) E1 component subunit alpha [Candidatus Competibacteraceae bacterium]|nr:pyruvate dehydrogenase (acetyl-transferring) E1 component subunit alpha [Candidatus Competibacteraceae bacterium]
MAKATYSKEQYLKWYEEMLVYRRIEERAGMVYTQQKIRGFLHLYIGQEAIVAGVISAIRPDDNMIAGYRNHVQPIGKGMHPKYMMAELYGKVTGCSKGMGGSMHMFSKEHRFYGGHGIVGGQIPMGAGLAFADKYRNEDRVTICYFGDGATRQGAFHETMNLAMLWKLPVLFVIENNKYAMGTAVERASNVTDLKNLGLSYNMPSVDVNGMDVEAVHECFTLAVAHARKGNGPMLIEAETYRYKGHSMSDPQKYRTKEEVEQYKNLDPIEKVLQTIRSKKIATEEEIDIIHSRVNDLIEECVKFAEESPYPSPEDLYKYVYSEPGYPFIMDNQ